MEQQPALRDIYLPQPHLWENLLQPGFLLLALLLVLLVWWLWSMYNAPFSRRKRRALRQLSRLTSISLADTNALLFHLLKHKQSNSLQTLNSDRDKWRRYLLGHNSRMPEFAETLAFHYRQPQAPDEGWLLKQLVTYIQGLK